MPLQVCENFRGYLRFRNDRLPIFLSAIFFFSFFPLSCVGSNGKYTRLGYWSLESLARALRCLCCHLSSGADHLRALFNTDVARCRICVAGWGGGGGEAFFFRVARNVRGRPPDGLVDSRCCRLADEVSIPLSYARGVLGITRAVGRQRAYRCKRSPRGACLDQLPRSTASSTRPRIDARSPLRLRARYK